VSTRRYKVKRPAGRSARIRLDQETRTPRRLLARINVGHALTWQRAFAALGLVTLAVLPRVWGPSLVPYRLRQELRQPLYARLDFTYTNPDQAEQIQAQVEREFSRFYQEDTDWLDTVFGPMRGLFLRAHALAGSELEVAEAAESLATFAESQDLGIDQGECARIVEELRNKQRPLYLYHDILDPANRILKNRFYGPGVLSNDDFSRERGRRVRVVSPGVVVRSAPVGSPEGAMSLQDARQAVHRYFEETLSRLDPGFRTLYADIVARQLRPTLSFLPDRTKTAKQEAIASRVEEVEHIEESEVLVPAGKPLTQADLERIRAETAAYEQARGYTPRLMRLAGMGALLLMGAIGFLFYLARFEGTVLEHPRQLASVALLAIVILWLLQAGKMTGVRVPLAPIGLAAGVAGLVFGPRAGVGAGSLFAFAAFLVTQAEVGESLALLGSSWIFALGAPMVRRRSGLLRSACFAGGVALVGTICFRLARSGAPAIAGAREDWIDFLGWYGAWDLVAWVLCGALLTVALPLTERLFGAATNVTLLELSDQDHPCLRRLILDAPGTYHHSVVVGNLAEAAAEAVGAHTLLARVASYYHDIGKLAKPEYFSENDTGRSPHDELSPTISTLIIVAHVKDGADLARQFDLPQAIVDIIEQHHGDSVVPFFYHRAQELAEDPDEVPEAAFRYPGPRPRSKEAAIVLLADCVEAASRTLGTPTPAHVRRLVHEVVMSKLTDHQLDDSPLSFRDVATIERSFERTLNAMFHSRVRYPEGAQPQTGPPGGAS